MAQFSTDLTRDLQHERDAIARALDEMAQRADRFLGKHISLLHASLLLNSSRFQSTFASEVRPGRRMHACESLTTSGGAGARINPRGRGRDRSGYERACGNASSCAKVRRAKRSRWLSQSALTRPYALRTQSRHPRVPRTPAFRAHGAHRWRSARRPIRGRATRAARKARRARARGDGDVRPRGRGRALLGRGADRAVFGDGARGQS